MEGGGKEGEGPAGMRADGLYSDVLQLGGKTGAEGDQGAGGCHRDDRTTGRMQKKAIPT